MTAARALAALLALLFLAAACGGGSGDDDAPSPSAGVTEAGDCGHIGDVASPGVIGDALITLADLPDGFTVAPADPSGLAAIGDQYFQENIDPAKYFGSRGFAFGSGDALEGGQGQFIAAIVVAFTDEDAASLLVDHPSTGEPTVTEPVDAVRLGDQSAALYFELETGEGPAKGYVYQFRSGQMVAYLANLGAGEDVTLEQTEELATLMCQRARAIDSF